MKELALGLLLLLPLLAIADRNDDDHHGRSRVAAPPASPESALYQEECGSCHLAYPPGFLPARSWDALLGGLSDHFGQNAELDPETAQRLKVWLVSWAAESGSHRRSQKFLRGIAPATVPLRITELPYWRRKHDEVSPTVFQREAVGSRANCAACHQGADQGEFDDDRVSIPKDAPAPR